MGEGRRRLPDWVLRHQHHIQLRPIQRATYKIEPSAELRKTRWAPVEKRAISMLLASTPTNVKEELVATRTLSPLGLVSKRRSRVTRGGLRGLAAGSGEPRTLA